VGFVSLSHTCTPSGCKVFLRRCASGQAWIVRSNSAMRAFGPALSAGCVLLRRDVCRTGGGWVPSGWCFPTAALMCYDADGKLL